MQPLNRWLFQWHNNNKLMFGGATYIPHLLTSRKRKGRRLPISVLKQ